MSGRWLVFNADDYGLSPATSAGIREALQQGAVRSTTIMANLATPDELGSLRQLLAGPQVGSAIGLTAGCHLNLSCGPPLTLGYPAELLRPGPHGEPWLDKRRALEPSTWTDPRLAQAAALEWEAQLTSLRAAGMPLSHLDSHHHVHLQPALFPIALALAQDHGLALRTRRSLRSVARDSGVATPDVLLERYFGAEHIGEAELLAVLDALPAPAGHYVEVMCHPGRIDAALRARSSYLDERETELATLCSCKLMDALAGRGWQLGGYHFQ